MKKITRRQFIKRASLGIAGGIAALHAPFAIAQMRGGGMGGGGGTSVIDPPPGAGLKDPVVMPSVISYDATGKRIVTVELTAQQAPVEINGVQADLLTYNGPFPSSPGRTTCSGSISAIPCPRSGRISWGTTAA